MRQPGRIGSIGTYRREIRHLYFSDTICLCTKKTFDSDVRMPIKIPYEGRKKQKVQSLAERGRFAKRKAQVFINLILTMLWSINNKNFSSMRPWVHQLQQHHLLVIIRKNLEIRLRRKSEDNKRLFETRISFLHSNH